MPTMTYMRHLLLVMMLAACNPTPSDPHDNLCTTPRDRTAECEARCAPGPVSEVCVIGWTVACFQECIRCNPVDTWCPPDAWCQR